MVSRLHDADGAVGDLRVGPRARWRESVFDVLVLLRDSTIRNHARLRHVVQFQVQVHDLGLSQLPVLRRGRRYNRLEPSGHDITVLRVAFLLGVLVRRVANYVVVVAVGLLALVKRLVCLLRLAGILLLNVGPLVVHEALGVLLVHDSNLPTDLLLGPF